ncbi:MAG: hypothetical protein IIB33_00430, partial [Chloroflexi bacterium]|nr:hypothetical protein [Chloroflexota bacterium]
MSEEDADPLAFARGVYSSVKSQFPTLESVHFLSGSDNDVMPPRELAAGVVNSIFGLGDRRVMLVWDDFHKASENQSVCQLVDLIIEHLPQSCSLVIASRTMPELGILDRLLAYREALVLRADDLALTASEVHALLVFLRGESVSMESAQNILDQTGGWVGGVLASEAGNAESHMSVPAGDHALRVFAASALSQEPSELQYQLMATSVLPYMDTDLCNTLLDIDDSERMLDRAYARIGFMSRMGDKSHAYKWHDLIREGLEAQFRSEYPAEYREAALRAGNALQARGEYEHAIELYLKADEHNSAAKLLTQEGSRLIAEGRWNHLDSMLTRIPAVELDEQPALLNLRGRVSARLGDKEAAISFFNKALAHLEETEEPVEAARTLVSRSSTYSLLGFDREAEEDARAAVSTLEHHKDVESDLSRAYRQLGWINLRKGRLEEAEGWLVLSSMALRRDADVRDTAMVSAALGLLYIELGKTPEAHTYLDKAVQGWRR